MLNIFNTYLNAIDSVEQRDKVDHLLTWISSEFKDLVPVIKWNQPMFTLHDTYIIGLSISKKHIAISPEVATIKRFETELITSGYSFTDNIIRIAWHEPIQYELIKQMIAFQMKDKAGYSKFWR